MQENKTNLLAEVADYYTKKLVEYGESARGVDWNGGRARNCALNNSARLLMDEASFHSMILVAATVRCMIFLLGAIKSFSTRELTCLKA